MSCAVGTGWRLIPQTWASAVEISASLARKWQMGDAKLLGALGAWVDWQVLPTIGLYAAGAELL